jgi:hypothetical protein
VKPVQTVASAKILNILHRIESAGAFLANPDEFPHRLHLLVPSAEVTLANGLPHEFRDGSSLTRCARVKSVPEIVVKVQLRPPHDVYYTSSSPHDKYVGLRDHTIIP